MLDTSKLIKMRICNIGCIGPEGCDIALDNILCLVGSNNSGKSVILRAYELAIGTVKFDPDHDLCLRCGAASATVEIWVHVPEGIANIAEKWKADDGYLKLVRSKWEWNKENNWSKVRTTWDPETEDYAVDDKASGLDTVFASRLPIPFRIGSLESPQEEHNKLLTLILQPIADKIKMQMEEESSELRTAISRVGELAKNPVAEEKARLDGLKINLNRSHNAIFPDLEMDFNIGIGEVEIDPLKMLVKNSKIEFTDLFDKVSWAQQGSGSQRALFWTILQVRSRLKTVADIADQNRKDIVEFQKRIKKLQSEADKAKKEEARQVKLDEIQSIEEQIQILSEKDPEDQLSQKAGDLSLPGYMLLIDEPEIALHPNAIRSASRYLYSLAEDSSWQVMLATHSPLFIDPLQDHTTIVRLTRSDANPSPKTYRSDKVTFSTDEKENLKVLNRFDQGLAEMFFGQFPILVEGDTEYAVFEAVMNKYPEQFPISKKPVLVRARGKYTMLLIMRILGEFRVSFAILHDADTPYRKDGKKNGAWTANNDIYLTIKNIREQGVRVVHRISLPGFEYVHLPFQLTKNGCLPKVNAKEKPWVTFDFMRNDSKVEKSILAILTDLINPESAESLYGEDFNKYLDDEVQEWACKYCPDDPRFALKS